MDLNALATLKSASVFAPSLLRIPTEKMARLSIKIPNQNINEVIDKLKRLSIVPSAIFKTSCGLIVEWWTMRCQVILDYNNYIKLIEEFLEYVDSIGFNEWIFDTGCLSDSLPVENDNLEVIINPRFTVENFNNTGEIEINDETK